MKIFLYGIVLVLLVLVAFKAFDHIDAAREARYDAYDACVQAHYHMTASAFYQTHGYTADCE